MTLIERLSGIRAEYGGGIPSPGRAMRAWLRMAADSGVTGTRPLMTASEDDAFCAAARAGIVIVAVAECSDRDETVCAVLAHGPVPESRVYAPGTFRVWTAGTLSARKCVALASYRRQVTGSCRG
jgi:hypothetical protein